MYAIFSNSLINYVSHENLYFLSHFYHISFILSSDSGIDYNPSFVTILNIFLPMGTIFIRFMEFQCHPQGEALISEGLLMV